MNAIAVKEQLAELLTEENGVWDAYAIAYSEPEPEPKTEKSRTGQNAYAQHTYADDYDPSA